MRTVLLSLLLLVATAVFATHTPVEPSGVYAYGHYDVNTTLTAGTPQNVTASCALDKLANLCTCNIRWNTALKPDPSPTGNSVVTLSGNNCTCTFVEDAFTFHPFIWSFRVMADCIPVH